MDWKEHSGEGNRFFNPWAGGRTKAAYWGLFKWLIFSRNKYRKEKKRTFRFEMERPEFKALEAAGKDYLVWLGHSTVLLSLGGKTFITDPVFWDVNFIVKRKTPMPLPPDELPRIDYVLISHSHYDHLNTKSVRFLKKAFDPVFITGPGYSDYFRKFNGLKNISIDWWEEYKTDDIKITSLPVQHWSKRTFSDTNRMLWCSFLIERAGCRYYWIGDTGYYPGFKDIGLNYGPVDVLIVPVGAYEPRWFMRKNHVNPEEALRIGRDVRAKALIPIHWGTFDLTDEPLWLPIERLKEIHEPQKDPALLILKHGGHYMGRGG